METMQDSLQQLPEKKHVHRNDFCRERVRTPLSFWAGDGEEQAAEQQPAASIRRTGLSFTVKSLVKGARRTRQETSQTSTGDVQKNDRGGLCGLSVRNSPGMLQPQELLGQLHRWREEVRRETTGREGGGWYLVRFQSLRDGSGRSVSRFAGRGWSCGRVSLVRRAELVLVPRHPNKNKRKRT